jgi:segregation and condensation protein A
MSLFAALPFPPNNAILLSMETSTSDAAALPEAASAGENADAGLPSNGSPSNGFRNFRLNEFEGPLDLLLFLIKKNEVNIYDIPVAQITEQFLEYLACAPALDLDEVSEFHLEAARLVCLKSMMLLPVEFAGDDEDEDPRQELVERLIEYQKFKKLSALMEEKEQETEWMIERKRLQRTLPFADEALWQRVDVWDLLKIFSSYTSGLPKERIIDLYEEVTINEKTALLFELLEERKECLLTDLIVRSGSIFDFVCAFLAILELVKQHSIVVLQNRMFGDIIIRLDEQIPTNENENTIYESENINHESETIKRNEVAEVAVNQNTEEKNNGNN